MTSRWMECCEHSMVSIPAQTRSQVEAGQAEVIRDLKQGLEEASSPSRTSSRSWRCCGARLVTWTSWIWGLKEQLSSQRVARSHIQDIRWDHSYCTKGDLKGRTLRKIKLAVKCMFWAFHEGLWHLESNINFSELLGLGSCSHQECYISPPLENIISSVSSLVSRVHFDCSS